MPAPKSAAIKAKKPGSKTSASTNSLTTSLKKRMKKTKVGEGDKAVVKIVKGGVVKLFKTAKGIKVRVTFHWQIKKNKFKINCSTPKVHRQFFLTALCKEYLKNVCYPKNCKRYAIPDINRNISRKHA